MFIDFQTVKSSLGHLREFHPFFGITFLVCKKARLPVGKSTSFSINTAEENFLKSHYKPDISSKYFFQPFRTSSRAGHWLSPKYPFSGSQSTRTRGDFEKAFIHEKNTDQWGWSKNYVSVLRAKLERDKSGPIPVFWLAVWLYRDKDWPQGTTQHELIAAFFSDFLIETAEIENLFDTTIPIFESTPFLSEAPYSDAELLQIVEKAPDARPEEGGTLKLLVLHGVGPSRQLSFSPGERLTIITGDNGLGKTFLLECAWWSLTGHWAEQQAMPRADATRSEARITFEIAGKAALPQSSTIKYDWDKQMWPLPEGRPTLPGLIIYARVDGSFAVWDPVRHTGAAYEQSARPGQLLFTRDQVLHGLDSKIEGLLRDWVKWQHNPDTASFDTFKQVLRRLSPPDMMPLEPGEALRVPGESKAIPTLRHHYGVVPFTNESAGVKRIVTIAYLLVWAWSEHQVYSALAKRAPQEKLVVLIDEMEAHLHPKWQRVVLTALLDVATILSRTIQLQIIVSSHSPLILASVETRFSSDTDKLYHLQLMDNRGVKFEEVPFVRYGTVDDWLTSDLFELGSARSREGEHAIEKARSLLAQNEPDLNAIRETTMELRATLAGDDEFWPRWLYFSEKKGVQI
jgi:predicted ATPase